MPTHSARDRLLARYRDEHAGPPTGAEIALRCTDHDRFIMWVNPPAPLSRVACPSACQPVPTPP